MHRYAGWDDDSGLWGNGKRTKATPSRFPLSHSAKQGHGSLALKDTIYPGPKVRCSLTSDFTFSQRWYSTMKWSLNRMNVMSFRVIPENEWAESRRVGQKWSLNDYLSQHSVHRQLHPCWAIIIFVMSCKSVRKCQENVYPGPSSIRNLFMF